MSFSLLICSLLLTVHHTQGKTQLKNMKSKLQRHVWITKITVSYISYYVTHYNIRVIFSKDLTQPIVTCEISGVHLYLHLEDALH